MNNTIQWIPCQCCPKSKILDRPTDQPWWNAVWSMLALQRSRLRRPISKIRMILLMDAKTWMTSLIIMFAVRHICVQDSIFKCLARALALGRPYIWCGQKWQSNSNVVMCYWFSTSSKKPRDWYFHSLISLKFHRRLSSNIAKSFQIWK